MQVYKFYSLKDNKVIRINKREIGTKARDDEPSDDSEFKGSSHGWLVLLNPHNLDLSLSNPISRRHIKLPPIHNLPESPKKKLGWLRKYQVDDDDGMTHPYKTIGFVVHRYDPTEKTLKYMENSLDGLAIFIGNNHGFAMRASDFPELEPDSIYFTDLPDLIRLDDFRWEGPETSNYGHNFGGHNIGIYNYKDDFLALLLPA